MAVHNNPPALIRISEIVAEFGGGAPHSLSEYYAGGANVPSGASGQYGALPSSGVIRLSNFYGATKIKFSYTGAHDIYVANGWTEVYMRGSGTLTFAGSPDAQFVLVGGGAGGGSEQGDEGGGGGGAGGVYVFTNQNILQGVYNIVVAGGGPGGSGNFGTGASGGTSSAFGQNAGGGSPGSVGNGGGSGNGFNGANGGQFNAGGSGGGATGPGISGIGNNGYDPIPGGTGLTFNSPTGRSLLLGVGGRATRGATNYNPRPNSGDGGDGHGGYSGPFQAAPGALGGCLLVFRS